MQAGDKMYIWLYRIAWLAFVAGAGMGLVALIAPVGVVSGLWDYRIGFQILRAVVSYSPFIAGTCLLLAIVLGILVKWCNTGGMLKVIGLAAAGSLAAGLVWYIPNSYQAPAGQSWPPIHDITTDTDNPPAFVAVLPLRVDAPNPTVYGTSRDMTPELLTRLQQEAYPDIQPRLLEATPEAVFDRALAAVDSLGWELVAADRQAGRIEATDTTFWFRFKDDIVIRIRAEGSGSRVDARSVSRVGRGDAGTNAKRLRRFFEEL